MEECVVALFLILKFCVVFSSIECKFNLVKQMYTSDSYKISFQCLNFSINKQNNSIFHLIIKLPLFNNNLYIKKNIMDEVSVSIYHSKTKNVICLFILLIFYFIYVSLNKN